MQAAERNTMPTEDELYKELGALTRAKDKWAESMEAPEIFRVLGKRRPDFVSPYIEELQKGSETDGNRVVRIHCQGAIKAASFAPII